MLRTVSATVLVVLACLLAAPAVAAVGLSTQITDRDRYLTAITPLADDPTVQGAITEEVTAKAPAATREAVARAVRRLVESDQFRQAWVSLNRTAHPQVIAVLRGEDSNLSIDGDAILLDLGAVAENAPLIDELPEIQVELVSRPAIRRAAPAFNTLEDLKVVLPIATILLLTLGLTVSRRRGTTLIVTGIGLAVMMLALLLFRTLARDQLMDRSQSPALAGAFYNALTDYMTTLLWIVLVVGAALTVVGIVTNVVSGARTRSAAANAARRPRPHVPGPSPEWR